MLVSIDIPSRPSPDDRGAALVGVIIVMLIGFIAAAVIASSAIFVISRNADDRDNLQAYVAAESGRDAAVAGLRATGGCSANGTTYASATGAQPEYVATVHAVDDDMTQPTTSTGHAQACPGPDTDWVVITSTGIAPDGSTAIIDAVYAWMVYLENQAGGVLTYFGGSITTTVSSYTGDLVVRSGNYTCPNDATITGDLYVTNGSATFSSRCTVRGNVYVSGDVTMSSQDITITGDVIAEGDILMSSNGVRIGSLLDVGSGDVTAGGDIALTDTGSTLGTVLGGVTAAGTATVGAKWLVTGAVRPGIAFVPFDPTMPWVREVTKWVDLDAASDWSPEASENPCGRSAASLTSLLSADSTRLMLDYTTCPNGARSITLNSATLTRDVIFLVPSSARMEVALNGHLSGGHQMLFIHADNSRTLDASGEPKPDCGIGNQKDKFDVASGRSVTGVKIMTYSPCGLTGNVNSAFEGQLYLGEDNLNFGNGADYTCRSMSWPPAFPKFGCTIRGGIDPILVTVRQERLDGRLSQSERG